VVKNDDLDEILYKYMPMVDEELINELQEQADKSYKFSIDFENKMEWLICENKHRNKRQDFWKYFRYIAAIIVVALVFCTPFNWIVRAYSGTIIEKVKMVLEDSFIYTYFVEGYKEEIVIRKPAYIPEGYNCIDTSLSDTRCYEVYTNEQGNQIVYQQMLIQDEMQVVLDLEYDTEKVVDLRGNKLTLYCYDDGYINAYYSIDNYIFTVTADNLSEEEIIKILDMILEEMLDMH
jgi:hypothetical protein